jgi:hypothetical protein
VTAPRSTMADVPQELEQEAERTFSDWETKLSQEAFFGVTWFMVSIVVVGIVVLGLVLAVGME